MQLRPFTSFLVLLLATTAYPAWAQDRTNDVEKGQRKIYAGVGFAPANQPLHREVGLAIGVVPDYEGADDYAAIATPLIKIAKPGAYFIDGASINPNDGLLSGGLSLVHFGYEASSGAGVAINLGPYFRVHPGRDEDEDSNLNGLGDIDTSGGLGLFLSIDSGQWAFQLAAAPHEVDKNTDDGLLVSLDISYTSVLKEGWTFATGIASSWANDEYTQGYFGVNTSQAVASGHPVYNAKAGIKDIGLYIHSSYATSQNWLWHTQIGYWEMQGDAADSPIVKAGSSSQLRALTGLAYRF